MKGKKRAAWLFAVLSLAICAAVGFLGYRNYETMRPPQVAVSLGGRRIAGVSGSWRCFDAFGCEKSFDADALALAETAPLWRGGAGAPATVYCGGEPAENLTARAADENGTTRELSTTGAAVVLPKQTGLYTVIVTARGDDYETEFAFRVRIRAKK